MNKIVTSLIALGALSGVAFADSASEYDREGIDQNFGMSLINGNTGASNSQALAVADENGMSAFAKVIASGKGDGSDR
jgi:hypothetical protein